MCGRSAILGFLDIVVVDISKMPAAPQALGRGEDRQQPRKTEYKSSNRGSCASHRGECLVYLTRERETRSVFNPVYGIHRKYSHGASTNRKHPFPPLTIRLQPVTYNRSPYYTIAPLYSHPSLPVPSPNPWVPTQPLQLLFHVFVALRIPQKRLCHYPDTALSITIHQIG